MTLKKINNSIIKVTQIHTKLVYRKHAFTLVEIMVWILIVSIVMVWWFKALTAITIWKAKLIQKTDIQKESFYFKEKLFEMIKKWWIIDYEEYFNRKVIWNTTYSSWHFLVNSWYGNFWKWGIVWSNTYWDWFYRCRSWIWVLNKMQWEWCYNNTLNEYWADLLWEQQRYWEYSFQFIDYNSNFDNDGAILWDEDWDGKLVWDYDDEYLWDWPSVFSGWIDLTELYLISWDKKKRTLFRWNVSLDPDAPSWSTCWFIANSNILTGTWCIWNIEYLLLDWKDLWMNHSGSWSSYLDWVIDTWMIDKNLSSWSNIIAWVNNKDYWVPLFSDSINVSEFKVYAYPDKDIKNAWESLDPKENISPYVFLKITLKPSWITRKKIKWAGEELDFSMTINLSELYSK